MAEKNYGVHYLVSEHWSGFLPEADDKITDQPFYLRALWKKIIGDAAGISAVSKYLAEGMQKYFALAPIRVIPNVVNTAVFYPAITIQQAPRLIHISGLEALKNPVSIIKAFSIVRNAYPDATLDIFGAKNTAIQNQVEPMQLNGHVNFHSEVPQSQLADYVRQSTALILYSRYETFGCVIIEANACGIPVIVSDIPVFHETVEEGINGFFAKPNDPAALAECMVAMIKNRLNFDSNIIARQSVSTYSYETVGKQFSRWYEERAVKA